MTRDFVACRLLVPYGMSAALEPGVLEAAGLKIEESDDPSASESEPTLVLAADSWIEALEVATDASLVAVRLGDSVTLALPVITIPAGTGPAAQAELLRAAAHLAESRWAAQRLAERAAVAEDRVTALNDIGIALSAEHDLDALLQRILTEARRFSGSAAGSLYLIDDDGQKLRFVQAQCDDVDFEFQEVLLPVSGRSIAGHVARTGETVLLEDAYQVPSTADYAFNPAFDEATGFRTRAMLALPMRDHEGQLVGVLQLMNPALPSGGSGVYSADLVPLLSSLATQAAVSVRATQLTEALRDLFDSFASAAVTAIELRDPTTAGHSHRVAEYSIRLAEAIDRISTGRFAAIGFSRQELTELRYAALLHDFGKIGVPERVLVKAKKLEDHQLELIRERLAYARDAGNDDAVQVLLRSVREGRAPSAEDLEELARLQARREAEFEQTWAALLLANEPTVLAEESGATLRELTQRTVRHRDRGEIPLLSVEEFELLSIRRGSLSAEERRQIESHVTHTVRFLATIPWTPGLRRIPEIAGAHHEKLDGGGYPAGLGEPEIPLQSRILAVSDIFDALTAADRPYKKAVPRDRSLAILEDEARAGVLDRDVVDVFIGLASEGGL